MSSIANEYIVENRITYSNTFAGATKTLTSSTRWISFSVGTYNPATNIQQITVTYVKYALTGTLSPTASTVPRYQIYCNGTLLSDVSVSTSTNQIVTVSCSGRLQTLRLNVIPPTFTILGNTGLTGAGFDKTITLQTLSPYSTFITAGMAGGKFIKLPPVSSHTNPMYIKGTTTAVVGNSTTSGSTGTGSNRVTSNKVTLTPSRIWIFTFDSDSTIDTTNSASALINSDFGCLTLFSSGSRWMVGNYYSSTYEPLLTLATPNPTGQTSNANINTINVFNTTGNAARNGQNTVVLPKAGLDPATCIIAYVGNQSTNQLVLQPQTGQYIDTRTIGGTLPYIASTGSDHSTGILLFTPGDQVNWYVIGWFNSSGWVFENMDVLLDPTTFVKTMTTDVGYNRQRICLLSNETCARKILPNTVSAVPYVLAMKAQTVISQVAPATYTILYAGTANSPYDTELPNVVSEYYGGNAPFTFPDVSYRGMSFNVNGGYINESALEYSYRDPNASGDTRSFGTNNMCVWFVSELRDGETQLRYYPIMSFLSPP
jgi:hypothetical protein